MHILNSLKSGFFKLNPTDFNRNVLGLFRFQYQNNSVYRKFVSHLDIDTENIKSVGEIPFLPIEFFKTHQVTSLDFQPKVVFESSGTTGMERSKHFVQDVAFYNKVAKTAFESFYGPLNNYHVFGLLPSYLERNNASLAFMVQHFIEKSQSPLSGFFLHNHENLAKNLDIARRGNRKILLIGVTFALLDFSEKFPIDLSGHIVMETGGMKGRREEWTRDEVHRFLKRQLNLESVHSEYGMTELLSQAYCLDGKVFQTPPWMKILIREIHDPFSWAVLENPAVSTSSTWPIWLPVHSLKPKTLGQPMTWDDLACWAEWTILI